MKLHFSKIAFFLIHIIAARLDLFKTLSMLCNIKKQIIQIEPLLKSSNTDIKLPEETAKDISNKIGLCGPVNNDSKQSPLQIDKVDLIIYLHMVEEELLELKKEIDPPQTSDVSVSEECPLKTPLIYFTVPNDHRCTNLLTLSNQLIDRVSDMLCEEHRSQNSRSARVPQMLKLMQHSLNPLFHIFKNKKTVDSEERQ